MGLSQAEAKEQLAQLILLERDLERRVSEIERQQERWKNRLDLARDWNEEDLAREAESVLRGYLSEAESLNAELGDVRLQKDKLRQAARSEAERRGAGRDQGPPSQPGPGSERIPNMEGRFQKMEVDSDLKGLKDRIRRELGE
jgi:phage shock protein A